MALKIHLLTSPINGRELHEQLGIEGNYTTWFSRMCEYGFAEKADYEKRFQIWKAVRTEVRTRLTTCSPSP